MTQLNNLSERFKEERIRLGLSQTDIADKTAVSVKTVGRWEKEIALPSDKLSLLSSAGFDLLYILTGQHQSMVLNQREMDLIESYRSNDEKCRQVIETMTAMLASNRIED